VAVVGNHRRWWNRLGDPSSATPGHYTQYAYILDVAGEQEWNSNSWKINSIHDEGYYLRHAVEIFPLNLRCRRAGPFNLTLILPATNPVTTFCPSTSGNRSCTINIEADVVLHALHDSFKFYFIRDQRVVLLHIILFKGNLTHNITSCVTFY